jgi:dsRNA-specific ribonuclease
MLGYKFKNRGFLIQALTHKSFADNIYHNKKIKIKDYNLLEFLGDSLVNFYTLAFFYRNSQNY